MNKTHLKIVELFKKYPDVLYGFSHILFSNYKTQYKCALVFAVPHTEFLQLNTYKEDRFEGLIVEARKTVDRIQSEVESIFIENDIVHEFPPVAQSSEETLIAPFSFKFSAVHAGLGWIGKNGVLITEKYGPRVRLAAVLIDFDFPLGNPVEKSKCPEDCLKCVKSCPYGALMGKQWDIHSKRSDLIDYQLCNQKRSLYIKSHNRKHACGFCMVSCPVGEACLKTEFQ